MEVSKKSLAIVFCIYLVNFTNCFYQSKDEYESEHKITHHVTIQIKKEGKVLKTLMVLGLYGEVVPKTVENFVKFCEGVEIDGHHYSYEGVPFHRVIPNFMVQSGDIVNHDGTGSISIYGEKFDDENFIISHRKGVIAMANRGVNTNGSQFYITLVNTPWLNGRHVVFGQVIKNPELIQIIESTGSSDGKPNMEVLLHKCTVERLD